MIDNRELKDIELILELLDLVTFTWQPSFISIEEALGSRAVTIITELCESDYTEVELKRGGQFVTELSAGDLTYVKIDLPKGKHCCLARTFDDLLSSYYLHALPKYAIALPRYVSWNPGVGEPPEEIRKIQGAEELIIKLEHHGIMERDGHARTYVVHTHTGKTTVPFHTEHGYISSVSSDIDIAIDVLAETFADTIHASEKQRIFRNAIADAMRSCDSEQRLKHLLKHASEILLSARNNYDLFVSSFSFQNDQEKLYEQKREFNVKLNGLLTGIQGKLLAIPVSTILATSQLKNVGEENYLLINAAIIFSSAFFTLIISWLIVSQLAALKAIGTEIATKEKRFKVELPRLFSEVETIFESLKSACSFNTKVAKSILGLSIFLFGLTLYVYVLKTPYLQDLLYSAYVAAIAAVSWSLERIFDLATAIRARLAGI